MKALLPVLLMLAGGCAHYEYDLVRPADLARHIGTKADAVVQRDPLEHRFISFDDRLVIRIYNPTDDPIELIGPQSTAVDPGGQSHPLHGATMEPHTFIKLILPPPRPVVQPIGPTIGFGLMASSDRSYEYGGYWSNPNLYDPYYDEPSYFVVYDDNDATYWDWRGETEVRLALMFSRQGKSFRDEFVFGRVRVKH